MKGEFESVLFLKDNDGRTIGFYRNHIESRSIKLYSCNEMSLEEIKDLHNAFPNEKTDKVTTRKTE